MRFPFGYSITKPFPVKYSYFLLTFCILSGAAFFAVNVFLAGYDVISITATHYNSTHEGFPMWRSSGTVFGCNSHQFQLGDTFRTNISAFSYSIFDVQPSDSDTGGSPLQGGFLYANEDLSSCDVDRYEITVRPGDRLITSTASIKCPPPLCFGAVTSWSYSNHAMIGALPAAMFPTNSLARAITDGMNNVSDEAYLDIYDRLYTTVDDNDPTSLSQHVYKVIAEGQPNCDSSAPFFCVIPTFASYNAIGNTDLNILPSASSIAADERNLYNVINVFYAAVRLDLGHWTADNVFTNTTSFKQLIPPTDGADRTFRTLATSKGMAYVNFTTPPSPDVSTSPAVIQIPYTCNVMRRKPIGSFIVSVVSATLSMFLGAWSIILAILSTIVRKNPGGACPTFQTQKDVYLVSCF
ncbi:hypothetical protein C8J57DRAFT_1570839 [Mycena rebaudengoi]|nr:hypothetical protein C8J57DRAFT_1570839 [Mycena rebaudengoi]